MERRAIDGARSTVASRHVVERIATSSQRRSISTTRPSHPYATAHSYLRATKSLPRSGVLFAAGRYLHLLE